MLISSEVGTVVDSLFAGNSIILAFTFLLFFALCVAIVVLTAMIIIQRFNKNLIGDEGYLMFTLPVSHVQLLTSKLTARIALGYCWHCCHGIGRNYYLCACCFCGCSRSGGLGLFLE